MSNFNPTELNVTKLLTNPINDNIVNNNSKSKSQKIRELAKLNFTKSQIALMLDIRYQHVRNVLLQVLKG